MRGNIIHIFSKFVAEGKATIKFKEPAHDLSISKVGRSALVAEPCKYLCVNTGGPWEA